MDKIIEKTFDLIDVLDQSDIIKCLEKEKRKLYNDEKILEKIKKYQEESDINKQILKKELYQNSSFYNYQKNYNELQKIVMKINKELSLLIDTRMCINENN